MKGIITVLIFISTLSVFGQNHFVGLKNGVNWTNINSINFISNNNYRLGYSGGLTYEYRLTNHFNIGVDLLFSQKGFTNDIIFTDEFGNPTGGKSTTVFNYDYLTLPMKGGFLIGNKLSGFANIGIVPSILINAETIEPKIEGLIDEKTTNITDRVSKFDFGGLIEIGGQYIFKDRLVIFTSVIYQQSFTSITNTDYFSNSKIKHYGMTVSVGIKYALKKKEKP